MTGFCLHFPWFQNSGSVAGIQNWRSSAKFLVSASWCLLQRASFGTALPFFPAVKQQAQLLSILKLSWNLWLTIDSKTTFTFPPLFRLLRTCTTYANLSFWLFLLLLGVRSIKKVLKKKKKEVTNNKKKFAPSYRFSAQYTNPDCNGYRSFVFPWYSSFWSCREKETF